MDASREFFGKLRALALTLEKEARQLEQALRGEDTDYEDESPIRVLHDLHCEMRTLKEDVNTSLGKSCSEKQAIHDFMKASEILMQRNAADLGKIRELFQKYGYKPLVKDSTEKEEEVNCDLAVSVQNKSDEEKADDVPSPSACTEKPPVPKDPLRNPQLSDFGLSQYAFSRPWSAVKGQHATNAHQENAKNRTLQKTQSPCILPKTPKCMLKMDDYECATPKLEHFGISEHTMCMNEDFTMSLIRKAAQTSKNSDCCSTELPVVSSCCANFLPLLLFSFFKQVTLLCTSWLVLCLSSILCVSFHVPMLQLVKNDDHEVNITEMTSRKIMVTPGRKPKMTADNADWMASPMILVFCTPETKTPSRRNRTLSRSPETNELPHPTQTPQFPDFETRWLKTEAKVVNSNYVLFHTIFTISSFSNVSLGFFSKTTLSCVKQGEKIESVTKNDATDKQHIEDSIPSAVSSDDYLKHFEDPSPPEIKHYDQLLNTPPPPEITRIPDDVLQILSKYNHKVDSSKAKEMETKAGNTTRYESDFTDSYNKENRGYPGFFKPNI
ncbi:SKA3 protein, partial [Rhinoptilus africanus]|nr:SKA3 protein [Rhinoptilus africanus]